ncbi:ATP-dependent nuclease [Paenarthrobacter nicotinovorans]|uniref:ATP-dependent nuclease n=1 Tax=Paenarthrobacter nicotinovorans TaxID=29320 RepID=UPI003815BEF5
MPKEENSLINVKITTLQFSDSTTVEIPDSGVVLIVGPNNSGKSQSLRDIMGISSMGVSYSGKAVREVGVEKAGSQEEILSWTLQNLSMVTVDGIQRYDVPGWAGVDSNSIAIQWSQPGLNVLTPMFIYHADATSRLTAGNSVASIDFSTAFATHPIQKAYRDGHLEREIDKVSREAFGLGISVDRYSGSVISLRVGEPPEYSHERGVPSSHYVSSLQAMPRLEDQGDGVRSYVGLLLHILGGVHRIMLVDEPEAFLHPPQARRLGKVLAERTAGSQQVFLATHSSDVVQGALDAKAPVTIVRMTRNGQVNTASVLDAESVAELWSDPLLRYSNVLDGLFHDAVVLCESDSDCRYYAAVLDSLREQDNFHPSSEAARRPQLLFTHCGGKARMSSVVRALKAAGVPVIVIADFDILKNSTDISRLVAELGGQFSEVQADLNVVSSALTSEVRPVSKLAVEGDLRRRLDGIQGPNISKQEMETLRSALRAESGWDRAKRSGIDAIPQGDPSKRAAALLKALESFGLLVVPVGELERFVPSVAGHGPAWVTEVLNQGLHKSPGVTAREFVQTIERTVVSR